MEGARWKVTALTEGVPVTLRLDVEIYDEEAFERGSKEITATTIVSPGEIVITNNHTIKGLPE